MYVCIYTYVHINTYIHTCIYILTYLHVCIHMHLYTHTHSVSLVRDWDFWVAKMNDANARRSVAFIQVFELALRTVSIPEAPSECCFSICMNPKVMMQQPPRSPSYICTISRYKRINEQLNQYTYIYIYVYTYIYIHIYYMYMHVHMYICTHGYTYIYIYTYTHHLLQCGSIHKKSGLYANRDYVSGFRQSCRS